MIYFNPRLREGGDIPCDIPCDISTISIHASVMEATIFPVCVALHHWYFNPRLREGGDRLEQLAYIQRVISIHASAREATLSFGFPPFALLFQSTPPRGRRQREIGLQHRMCSNFNPRLREGGDLSYLSFLRTQGDFNPRLREGGDATAENGYESGEDISIHASAREATFPR